MPSVWPFSWAPQELEEWSPMKLTFHQFQLNLGGDGRVIVAFRLVR